VLSVILSDLAKCKLHSLTVRSDEKAFTMRQT